jgi:hypothetical protein
MKRGSAGSTGHGRAEPRLASGPKSPPSSFANTSICTAWGVVSPKDGTCVLIMSRSDTVLSSLPQRPVAKVCKAGYPLGSRRRPQPSLRRPPASRQYLAALPAAYSPELNPKENLREKLKYLQELRPQINRCCARQTQAGAPRDAG